MIKPEEARLRAIENFKSGFNCTQSVAEVFAEELGFNKEQLISLALPFGAGTCRMRETCGTFSGLMLCLGMKTGTSTPDKETKDKVYAAGQEFARIFKKDNGSIICRELLGLAPKGSSIHTADSPVSEERTEEYYKKRPCAELCGYAAELFAKWLIENEDKA